MSIVRFRDWLSKGQSVITAIGTFHIEQIFSTELFINPVEK